MFGKKVLSLIGSLFVGSQLILLANATAAPTIATECGATFTFETVNECSGSGNAVDSYCISGTTIYALPASSGNAICKVSLDASKVNVISVDGNNSSKINLSGTDISASSAYEKLAIFNCDAESCSRTSGIVKGSAAGYYKIFASESGENASYEVDTSSCSASNIGGLGKETILETPTDVLCLSSSKFVPLAAAAGDAAKYIMKTGGTEGSVASSPFTLIANQNKVISVDTNYFVFDNLLTDEVFSNYDTNKIITRKENLCSGSILNTMYDCTSGSCTGIELLNGKTYLYDNKIYSFSGSSCTAETTSGVMAFKKNDLDDDPDASILLKAVGDFEEITEVTNIVLKVCTNGSCVDANGFVKYGASSGSLGKCTSGACIRNENLNLDDDCKATDDGEDVGKANYDGGNLKICTTTGDQAYGFESITAEKINFLRVTDGEHTKYSRYVFDSTGNAIAISQPANDSYYVMKNNVAVEATGEQTGSTLLLCTSTDCTAQDTIGYFVNAANKGTLPFIKCASATTCEVIETPSGVNCESGKEGLLIDGGKLCLGQNLADSTLYVSSTTFDSTPKYYVINNKDNNVNIYSDISNGALGLIKITANAMIFDSSNTVTASCLNKDTLEITTGECGANPAYSCSSGICTSGAKTTVDCVFSTGSGADCTANTYWIVTAANGSTIQSAETEGYLYYCETAGSQCKNISAKGYYVKSSTEYYTCSGEKCKKYTSIADSCIATNIGKLFSDATHNDGIYLCLYNEGSTPANGIAAKLEANSGRYVVGLSDVTKAIFDTTETGYAMIDVSEKQILLKSNFVSSVKYVYANTESLVVLTRGHCPTKTDDNGATVADDSKMIELVYTTGICTAPSS